MRLINKRVSALVVSMWFKRFTPIRLCLGAVVCLVGFALLAAHQQPSPQSTQSQPIRLTTSLVVVDALAQDEKTLLPVENLRQEDFALKDNGKPVLITSFARGQDHSVRPIQLWFVLMCNEQVHFQAFARRHTSPELTENFGSSFLAGKTQDLLVALGHLKPDETIGVAHWCDNAVSEIDVDPTPDHAAVVAAIESIAAREPVLIEQDNTYSDAREQVLALINNSVRVAFSPPFPAIISIGGQLSGGKSADAGSMEVSVMDFGFESEKRERPLAYKVKGGAFPYRLGAYIDSLHERYEFAFAPGEGGNKPHHVSVALTSAAKTAHPDAVLSYREIYIGGSQPGASPPTTDWKHLDSKMRAAVNSPQTAGDLKFELRHKLASNTGAQEFEVSIPANVLTWDRMPNGDHRCVVMTVIATYSKKGQPLAVAVKELEIVQESARLAALADKPVLLSLSGPPTKESAKVRVILRDVATGRIGAQDDGLPNFPPSNGPLVPKNLDFSQ